MCTPVGDETCAGVVDEDCDGRECGLWGRLYGDAANQSPRSLEVAPNGDIYLIGELGAPGNGIQFGGMTIVADAQSRHFLAKLSADGQELWIKKLPSQEGNSAYRILGASNTSVFISTHLMETIDLGGGPLSSNGWGDAAFAAFDSGDGAYQWGKTLTAPGNGGTTYYAYGLSPLNEVVIVGHAAPGAVYDGVTIANPASPENRVWYGLAMDGATGSLLWHHEWQVGALENNDTYRSLAFDAQGHIFITGSIASPASFGGPTLVPVDWTQGYVVHLDPDGQWVEGSLFCDDCYPEQIAIGPAGEVILSGYIGFYELGNIPVPTHSWGIFGLDGQYKPAWVQFMSEVPSIDIGASGDIGFVIGDDQTIEVGGAGFPAHGTIDLVAGKLALDGTMQWYRQLGAPGAKIDDMSPAKTFGLQPDGKAIILFQSSGAAVDFGFGPLAPSGVDIGVVQLAP